MNHAQRPLSNNDPSFSKISTLYYTDISFASHHQLCILAAVISDIILLSFALALALLADPLAPRLTALLCLVLRLA